MNETKFYKSGRIYYKVEKYASEKIYAYWHCFGIELTRHHVDLEDDPDYTEITEAQYNRVRKLILAKLTQDA